MAFRYHLNRERIVMGEMDSEFVRTLAMAFISQQSMRVTFLLFFRPFSFNEINISIMFSQHLILTLKLCISNNDNQQQQQLTRLWNIVVRR